jgi:hypothetical protein
MVKVSLSPRRIQKPARFTFVGQYVLRVAVVESNEIQELALDFAFSQPIKTSMTLPQPPLSQPQLFLIQLDKSAAGNSADRGTLVSSEYVRYVSKKCIEPSAAHKNPSTEKICRS